MAQLTNGYFPDATIELNCRPEFTEWKALAGMLRYQRITPTVWYCRQIYLFSYCKIDKFVYDPNWAEDKYNFYSKALADIQMKCLSCPIDVLLSFVQHNHQHETVEELEVPWLLYEDRIQEFSLFCANYNNSFPKLEKFVVSEHYRHKKLLFKKKSAKA
ncbi:unnamed protein product [Bursaphelenchus okinawaensis]|uniref:Uncharacterized protein n=1 Tax=Bursaphelenchus okinawaensis TaxID=465554 RepID=A0A811LK26_9BILA|nr:unnamed protein product [Bursaphelenchus okinawaensis]CAG9127353.1 unnamed protein product [Bursaphelenchus okinawaensis]